MELPKVNYTIYYNHRDITGDISAQVLTILYTDKVTGEADTIEISLHDADGLWQNGWYPEKGDTLQLIIRVYDAQLDCGLFEVDELALTSSIDGDVFIIRGIAAGIKRRLRTERSYAHEDKTLREISNTVAAGNNLTLIGTVPDIRIHRVHQYRETDLHFLNRIGAAYGCLFSVRGSNLVFYHYKDIEGRKASFVLDKSDLISLDIRDTSHKRYKSTTVKHHDPYRKQTVSYFSGEGEQGGIADGLEIRSRVENEQQAEAIGNAASDRSNTQGVSGDITAPGNLLFVAGNNFAFTGIGRLSGTYHIKEATHTIDRAGGHLVAGNIKRVKE